MTVKAGQRARKEGEYVCEDCEATVYIEKGQEIPTCPCGGENFQEQPEPVETQGRSQKPRKND